MGLQRIMGIGVQILALPMTLGWLSGPLAEPQFP